MLEGLLRRKLLQKGMCRGMKGVASSSLGHGRKRTRILVQQTRLGVFGVRDRKREVYLMAT